MITALINILLFPLVYLSVPLCIRYVIFRRPLKNKWSVFSILFMLFIFFMPVNNIRDITQSLNGRVGVQHRNRTHLTDLTPLCISLYYGYVILRKKSARNRNLKNETDEKNNIQEKLKSVDNKNSTTNNVNFNMFVVPLKCAICVAILAIIISVNLIIMKKPMSVGDEFLKKSFLSLSEASLYGILCGGITFIVVLIFLAIKQTIYNSKKNKKFINCTNDLQSENTVSQKENYFNNRNQDSHRCAD